MPHKATAYAGALALGLVVVMVLGQAVLDLPYEIRFRNDSANYWTVAGAAILAPVLSFLFARSISTVWPRRIGMLVAAVVALPCLLISSCAALEAPAVGESDKSYELLSEATVGADVYRLYRTNCGATCAYGLDLRKERELQGGIKLISSVWSLYRASEGQLKVDSSSVLVTHGNTVIGKVSR
jgi:hypothetical protein